MKNSALLALLMLSFTLVMGQNEKAMKHHLSGELALNNGTYEEAVKYFDEAIKADANSTWSYIYRGMSNEGVGNYEQAVNDYSKALELNPDLTVVYEYRGAAYSLFNFDKAIEDFSTAITYNPNSAASWSNRAWCYLVTRKLDKAIEDASKAIEIDSTYLLAYGTRGWAYYLQGDYQESYNDLKVAVQIDSESEHYELILDHYTKASFAVQSGMTAEVDDGKNLEKAGRFFALIIGNNKYDDPNIVDLDQPIEDAIQLSNVLVSQYTFEKEDVVLLKNATRADIIESLDELYDNVTEKDNLIIFYAGHGYWDAVKETGYWLPVDAKKR